jgi:hypothetical protein
VGHFHTSDEAVVDLLLLIAMDGIIEEEGEVREEVQIVRKAVSRHLGERLVAAVLPLRAEAVPIGMTAVALVD